MASDRLSRRRFLFASGAGAAATAAACAPGSAPAPGGGQTAGSGRPEWEQQWDDLVKAAKGEGKITIFFSGSGPGFPKIGQDFEAAFPGITAEVTALSTASLFLPRISQEREAGIYSWDVATVQAPYSLSPGTLRANGMMEPMRPLLFHPEVVSDQAWPGGFDRSWIDTERRWAFSYAWGLIGLLWINTDLVKEGEIKSVKDMLNPKWKGQIISADPRTHGQGFIPATTISMRHGFDILKQIWVDQEVSLNRDTRQITESLVRGKHAMGFGVTPSDLQPFQEQGLGKNIKGVVLDATAPLVRGINYISKAPHPNAAKLFLNWFLTKQGQTSWATNTLLNSRRQDVPVPDQSTWVDPKLDHPVVLDTEEMMNKPLEIAEHFKKILA